MKIHQFDPEIYPFKIWICISNSSIEPDSNFLDGKTGKEFDSVEVDMFEAYSVYVRHKESRLLGALIVFKSKKNMTTKNMAHEACHATKFLFEHIGASMEPHEPFEYALGWIVDKIVEVKNFKL